MEFWSEIEPSSLQEWLPVSSCQWHAFPHRKCAQVVPSGKASGQPAKALTPAKTKTTKNDIAVDFIIGSLFVLIASCEKVVYFHQKVKLIDFMTI